MGRGASDGQDRFRDLLIEIPDKSGKLELKRLLHFIFQLKVVKYTRCMNTMDNKRRTGHNKTKTAKQQKPKKKKKQVGAADHTPRGTEKHLSLNIINVWIKYYCTNGLLYIFRDSGVNQQKKEDQNTKKKSSKKWGETKKQFVAGVGRSGQRELIERVHRIQVVGANFGRVFHKA